MRDGTARSSALCLDLGKAGAAAVARVEYAEGTRVDSLSLSVSRERGVPWFPWLERGEEAYLYKSVFRGTSPLAAALGAAARGWQAPPGGGIGRWIEMSVKCA